MKELGYYAFRASIAVPFQPHGLEAQFCGLCSEEAARAVNQCVFLASQPAEPGGRPLLRSGTLRCSWSHVIHGRIEPRTPALGPSWLPRQRNQLTCDRDRGRRGFSGIATVY